ncbi:hypothetical protein B0H13DRAFT_2556773 [Mycena leptocephala]|nr:hypothetical protein B0H13DRAFT_2556773 [Mycena leptocephala]
MSAGPSNAKASILNKKKGGTTMQPLKSSTSHSDWLSHCIHIAKILKEAADLVPKVKQNREDLQELCENTTRIAVYLGEQLASRQNTTAVRLKDMCEEMKRDLQGVIAAITKLPGSRGLRGQVKEFFTARSITDKITGYQRSIQAKCETLKLTSIVDIDFKVAEIQTAIFDMQKYSSTWFSDFPSVQASQSTSNCPPASRHFLGRQIILEKMHQYFNQGLGKQQIYVLYGLGGAGKTQISLKFIAESSHFTDRFFLDASTTETIDMGLKTIATTSKIGHSSQDALKWFAAKQDHWLLFFDNADDPKIDLNKFLPKCDHGNIVITSRNPGLRGYGQHSQVSDMNETEAVDLLLKCASQDTSSVNKQIATEIVKAGAFILESGALDTYLELYIKNRARLLSERPAQTHDDYSWTVYTTWKMSFDKLTLPAAMFLQLCSFLHREGISEDIFSRAAEYKFPSWGPSKEELQKPLEFLSYLLTLTGEWDPLCFLKLTNEIKAYSLISFDSERKVFSIHPLVHAWGRTIITDPELYHSIMGAILGMTISEIPKLDIQLASLRLLPHVESVLGVNRAFSPDFKTEYAMVFYRAGKHTEAENLQMAVLEKQKQIRGDDHSDTLLAMNELALTYQNLGEFKKAEQLQVVVLEKRKQLLGDDHPETLIAMGNLAGTYRQLQEFTKAEELESVVLERRKQLLGDDHLDTLRAMANLAATYGQLKEFTKAEELELVVLEKQKQLLGEDHPDTLRAMGNLAATYGELKEFKKAEELEILVLEKRKQLLGDDHPYTLLAMGNLAATYRQLKESTKAEELKVIVMKKRKQLLGDDHPDTLRAMGNLAVTYGELQEFKKAEELELVVLEKQKQLLGHDHPDTLLAMGNLAATYRQLQEFKKAEELEIVVLEKRNQLLGDDHPDTLHAMANLAATYWQVKEFTKAEELEIVVLEKHKQLLGDDHPDTLRAMENLAATYHSLANLTKAEELEKVVKNNT